MKDTTLLFLIKKEGNKIVNICLAMKKRGFGMGRYNGVGGKVEESESIEDAVKRETKEEINVVIDSISKCAELTFKFPHNELWNQLVHVYFATEWVGVPQESEEMKPEWFTVLDIPYEHMWPADIFWIPKVLEGNFVKANIVFGEGDVVKEQHVEVV